MSPLAIWLVNSDFVEIPPLSGSALALVLAAGVSQIAAKFFYGLLFRESVQEANGKLRRWSAFKAALVGAGIARLIPAGGAITPVGMSWTVRDEVDGGSTGPAVRTVLLNYAGLLMMTGVGLFIARVEIPVFKLSLFVLSPFIFLLGVGLMFGSGKLGTLSKYLPPVHSGKGPERRYRSSTWSRVPDLHLGSAFSRSRRPLAGACRIWDRCRRVSGDSSVWRLGTCGRTPGSTRRRGDR